MNYRTSITYICCVLSHCVVFIRSFTGLLLINSLVQLLTHCLMFNLSVNWNQISRGSGTVPNSKNSRNNQSPAENDIKYPSLYEGSPTFHRCQISQRLTPKFKLKTHIGKVYIQLTNSISFRLLQSCLG